MIKLLIATTQQGKINEFKQILGSVFFKPLTLKNYFYDNKGSQETGDTYKKNAFIKAKYFAVKFKIAALADDSGLEVAGLPGKLGVKTKRYALGSDKKRYLKLLKKTANFSQKERQAKFVSCIAFYDPFKKTSHITCGNCRGYIATQPKTKYGFGYDPVFVVKKTNKYFSEMTVAEKNLVSHRAKAFKKMLRFLYKYYEL